VAESGTRNSASARHISATPSWLDNEELAHQRVDPARSAAPFTQFMYQCGGQRSRQPRHVLVQARLRDECRDAFGLRTAQRSRDGVKGRAGCGRIGHCASRSVQAETRSGAHCRNPCAALAPCSWPETAKTGVLRAASPCYAARPCPSSVTRRMSDSPFYDVLPALPPAAAEKSCAPDDRRCRPCAALR